MAQEWNPYDLLRFFPSVETLITTCGNRDRAHWGLRQHKRTKDISFGYATLEWNLVMPLEKIINQADEWFADIPHSCILVCYFVCLMTPFRKVLVVLEKFEELDVLEIVQRDPYRIIN